MDAILSKIHIPSIFCYPSKYFIDGLGAEAKLFEDARITNILFIQKAKNEYHEFKHATDLIFLFDKKNLLEKNIFEILKLKNEIDDEAFLFFLQKYNEQISTWLNLFNITKNDAKDCAINYLPVAQDYLNSQYDLLLQHQQNITLKFGVWEAKTKAKLNVALQPPTPSQNEVLIHKTSPLNHHIKSLSKSVGINKPNTKASTANPIPKVKDVDKDILLHFFNVDVEDIE